MTTIRSAARSRAVLLAVGAGVVGSLAFAGPTFANAPTGTACQTDAGGPLGPLNGKILGHGATFARNLQHQSLIPGYQIDVCGAVPDASHPSAMVLYNETVVAGEPAWPVGTIGSPLQTGSGSGIGGSPCRSAAFHGTDTPYSTTELTANRAAPPATTTCDARFNLNAAFAPVYQPTKAPTYPNATDVQAVSPNPVGVATGAMSFPVGGASIAVGINLTYGDGPANGQPVTDCPTSDGTVPRNPIVNLTRLNLSGLFGGTIVRWNDASLIVSSPELAACQTGGVGVPVTRVVRLDNSGTTTQFKNGLRRADNAPSPNPRICSAAPNNTWLSGALLVNQTWPDNPPEATCPAAGAPGQLVRPALNGGNNVVAETNLATRVGAIGYADLENWLQAPSPRVGLARVENEVAGNFVNPRVGAAPSEGSNCSFRNIVTPGTGASGAVGLAPQVGATWATNAIPNRSDVTYTGNTYPICALTWVLVHTGLSNPAPVPNASAISRLTHNQRRTLWSFLLYSLSPQGQERLSTRGYAPISGAPLDRIRQGFATHF